MLRPSAPPFRVPSYNACELDRGLDNAVRLGRFYDERLPFNEKRAYRLDVCRDGTLTISEFGQRPFNNAALPALTSDSLEKLKLVQATVGKLDYETDDRTAERPEGGKRYVFSWGIRTGTLAQLHRIGDVCWLVHEGRMDEAVALAIEYDQLAAQEDPESYGAVYEGAQ